MTVEYDGTEFAGWQIQSPDAGRTVQGTIQEGIHQFTGENVSVVGSGRTDAGVHARGQVAHLNIQSEYTCEKIKNALNGVLPNDIAVLKIEDVDDSFHARYSARERRYSYSISTQPVAIDRRTVWSLSYPIDFNLLIKSSEFFNGEGDYKAFTKSMAEVKHYRCSIYHANWEINGSLLTFYIYANRFLHGMVRSIVGTMIEVGRGYFNPEQIPMLLETGRRDLAGPLAPPHGLVLEEVIYE